jgi:hypothetical protein
MLAAGERSRKARVGELLDDPQRMVPRDRSFRSTNGNIVAWACSRPRIHSCSLDGRHYRSRLTYPSDAQAAVPPADQGARQADQPTGRANLGRSRRSSAAWQMKLRLKP